MAIYNITSQQLKGTGILNSFEMSGVGSFPNVYSFAFDGSDDSIQLVNDIVLGTTNSVSFWIKRNDTAIAQPLGCVTAWSDFLVRLQTTKISFGRVPFIFDNSTTLSTINQTSNWTHLLFSRNGANCNLFVNGVDNDGAKTNANASWQNKFRVIGGPGDGSTWLFNGNIDEVAVFDSVLSATDASNIYNSGIPTSLASYSPLAWFRMGEEASFDGTDWILTDQGSNGNNATSENMAEDDREEDVPS